MGFTDAQLLRFAESGENELSYFNLVRGRYSFKVLAGVAEYAIPSYIKTIVSITYKGESLNPWSGSEMRRSGTTPVQATSGIPREYVYSDFGTCKLKLFPTPSETVNAQVNLWGTAAILNGLVIDYWSYSRNDSEELSDRLLDEIRSTFIDDYVFGKAYAIESKEQDFQAATYYKGLWQENLAEFPLIEQKIHQAVNRELKPQLFGPGNRIARPRLPLNFGRVVE